VEMDVTRPQKPSTYRQLFGTLSPHSPEAEKIKAITDGYIKLRKHFEKIPEQTHMTTWPESLMALTPQELCKAFEEAQREEFCPTAGVLWKSAQRDRDAVRDEEFTEHWRYFLRMLKKHGREWEPAQFRIAEPTEDHPVGKYETRPAPVLDPGFEVALEKAMGCDIRQARRAITAEHPHFGIVQTSEPALRAQQIEKRVREVWMRNGRP
jgi:hypothetical protein